MLTVDNIKVETDGTIAGTKIYLDGDQIGCVQYLQVEVEGDPSNRVYARLKYYRKTTDTAPAKLADLKNDLQSPYGVYVKPFTGNFIFEDEVVNFTAIVGPA